MRSSLCMVIVSTLVTIWSEGCQRSPAGQSQSTASSSRASDQARVERDGMVLIKGGKFLMGTDDGMPFEAPIHEVSVKSFWIDRHEVSVAEFAKFVAATGYKTDAENFGWSGAFNIKNVIWEKTRGANWNNPDVSA